jgi:ATP-dependent RNA helicase SUPV3L1/SUV3
VRAAGRREFEQRRDELAERVRVRPPVRRREPETVVAHLGPTNSGKTHDALQFLLEEGRGVFAAPLRMLAQEAYARLAAQAGEEAVGLVTGEERVNDRAPILCCTTEMAPRHGGTLVLDEAHWTSDRDRGHAWTRLLAAAEYRHVRLLGAPDALPLVRAAFPEAELRVHERLAPLDWAGEVHHTQLEPGTVVIAFSRKAVLFLSEQLAARYGRDRVAALYGAMPLDARRQVIEQVRSGARDLVVATDVLGHGVNLPARAVVFAETQKYDGRERRDLEPWEAAQIAGRAGRFGLAERGQVGVLTGMPFFQAHAAVAQRGLAPTEDVGEGLLGFRRVWSGRLRAELDDLAVTRADDLDAALSAWERVARGELHRHEWLWVESTWPARQRLRIAEGALSRRGLRVLDVELAWRLASAPLDADDPSDKHVLRALTLELVGNRGAVARMLDNPKAVPHMELADAERAARVAQAVRWAAHAFPELEVSERRAARVEQAAADRVVACLHAGRSSGLGTCRECGAPCAPWFSRCDLCHQRHDEGVAAAS